MGITNLNLVKKTQAELGNGDLLILPCSVNYYYITKNSDAEEAVKLLLPITSNPDNIIGLDIETTGFDPYLHDIILLQIGTKDNIQYIFDLRLIDISILVPIFVSPCWKCGHNIKFDAKFINIKAKVSLSKFFDTYLAEMVIRGGAYTGEGYSLDAIIKKRLSRELKIQSVGFIELDKVDRVKKTMQTSFLTVKNESLTDAQLAYAAQDVSSETLLKIASLQTKELKEYYPNTLYDSSIEKIKNMEIVNSYKSIFPPKLRLWETALLEFKFLELVIQLELNGIGFNIELHSEVLNNIETDYKNYRKEFLNYLTSIPGQQKTLFGGASVNPDSTKQLLEALNRVGLNLPDTSADILENKLHELTEGTLQYNLVNSLLNYRVTAKLISSFGETLAQHVHPITKRIHYTVKQILDTGRISNADPNLQQIVKKINWKKSGKIEYDSSLNERLGIRECFQAKPGYRFVIFDYSQQELRVAASNSHDENMLNAFIEGKELHSYSATLMYNEDYESFVKKVKAKDQEAIKKRSEAKVVSFGALYGSGSPNLANKLRISLEQARDILDRFWSAYPQLSRSMKSYGEFAIRYGYSNTVLGRRRHYTDLINRIKWIESDFNPASIQKKLEDNGVKWFLEANGNVTYDNIEQAKKAIIKKLSGRITRQAGNHTVQGSSADITKLAAVNIRKELLSRKLDAQIVGLVHDEIIVEVALDSVNECKEIIENNMKEALNIFCPLVPAEADGSVDIYWKKD